MVRNRCIADGCEKQSVSMTQHDSVDPQLYLQTQLLQMQRSERRSICFSFEAYIVGFFSANQ